MLRNGLEPWHLLVVLAVVVLLFGSKKLPEMARGLGKSMRILKAETAAMREEDQPATSTPATGTPAAGTTTPGPAAVATPTPGTPTPGTPPTGTPETARRPV
ncbi:Sec-independent protein translocase subunit TatA [Kitasatospora sp. NPDC058162]|uniref:Sec-independent protein translocase subunit TatA n=1 Tax=Kitasatospora sp. NPDC058162 TaxID=3346362 RepID=UPI0036DA38DF